MGSNVEEKLEDLISAIDSLMHVKHRINNFIRYLEKNQQLITDDNPLQGKVEECLKDPRIVLPGRYCKPNQMDFLLITNKISMLCDHISQMSTRELQKIKLMRSVI